MPFDWQEFLNLAETLLQTNTDAAHRSAISRAYYSIFNVARERAERNNCVFPPDADGGMHKKCWNVYKRGPDPTCKQLGVDGGRLAETRVRADYKNGDYVRLAEEAAQVIRDARSFRNRLNALDQRYPLH